MTASAALWHVGGDDFSRTISSVVIADGLLYAVDLDGFFSCLDVQTGRRHWQYDMEAGVWASPTIIDGKVILGNTDGELVILRHGKTLEELARIDMRHAVYSAPAAVDGVLYVLTQRFLYAIAAPAAEPVAGGWPMFRGDPQLTGVAGDALPERLRVRWSYEAAGAITSTAAIAGGVVYVGSEEQTLYALDLAAGGLKWRYEATDAIESSPTVIDGIVVFGDDAGVLHACDAQTGAARWTFKTDGQIISSVNCCDGRLVFGSYDGRLYCLQAADGALLWKYELEDRAHATPAIAGPHVLIAGCDAHLHVVKLADGTLVRKVPLDSVTGCSPAVRGQRVFLGTYGERVLGVDWQAGRVLWRFEDSERSFPYLSSAAVTENLVIVGGRDKRLHALDQQTGQQRWQFVTKGRVDSSPVVVGERVFVGSADGNLYAVKLADGKALWRFEAGGGIYASPAVADGCLVIGTEDGVIYCFGGQSPAQP